jgi:hypothetical protein
MTPAKVMHREDALATVVRVVAPYFGETMATAAVEMHRNKLGLDGAVLTEAQLDALLHKIGMGLVIFVGRKKSEQIVRDARAAATQKEHA